MAKKQSPSTLLWFIRRKAYVQVCEIRRRFELDGEEGSFLDGDNGSRVFVGLPANTASAVEKLWRQGKIGLELSVEFDCQVVIGIYPLVPLREPQIEIAPRPVQAVEPVPLVEEAPVDETVYEGGAPGALAAGE